MITVIMILKPIIQILIKNKMMIIIIMIMITTTISNKINNLKIKTYNKIIIIIINY